ncbi:20982_t:CDS:2 [Gigaspora margarita]|uniref:20982_t:CDS:1 n=1 Tax=Gigaspora margarita TaxID=4874 RepID=A0ABN7V0S0_GIGMA|nr:20982_t:CDS:2 [Gigaspora margarita]
MLRYISNYNTSSGKTQYKILDRYLVETSWGRKSRHTIECEIKYNSEGPVFIIRFNENSQQHRKGSNSYARISGIHVFGLNAIDVKQGCECKRKENRAYSLKPFSMLCESMKTKCSCSFSLHISKNYLVDYCKEKEDQNINAFIPIFILDFKNISITTTNKISHINDDEVEKEMLKYIRKAGYRKIIDILLFVIPGLVNQNILNINNLVIHIRISGDGRNIGRKIKHVMVMFTILDDILNIHKAEFHYTIILYSGNENYEKLQKVMKPIINELHSLVNNGLDSSRTRWKIISYFSSDWKFLSIILGFNAANANYFCPWCLCSKKEIGIKSKVYIIEKTMEQLQTTKPPPDHSKAPLLYIILLEHYVPDLLHVMLRIWDRMWSLVIQELKSENRYDNNIRTIISSEMQKISIKFHFWQDHNTQNWNNTPLIGDDKELRDFYILYNNMKQQNFDPGLFSIQARNWLDLFLTPSQGAPNSRDFKKGLYRPKDVTPYIHVLVNHICEFIERHSHFGFVAFSYAVVKKKNHNQVSTFFKKTMKDSSNGAEQKSAIYEILCYKNHSIYFSQNSTFNLVSKHQHIHIKNNSQ